MEPHHGQGLDYGPIDLGCLGKLQSFAGMSFNAASKAVLVGWCCVEWFTLFFSRWSVFRASWTLHGVHCWPLETVTNGLITSLSVRWKWELAVCQCMSKRWASLGIQTPGSCNDVENEIKSSSEQWFVFHRAVGKERQGNTPWKLSHSFNSIYNIEEA